MDGKIESVPLDYDLYQFGHGILSDSAYANKFVGIRVIRDPRDIIVSGYLYHKRTSERWANRVTKQGQQYLGFPDVPKSLAHESDENKMKFVSQKNGISYREMINSLSTNEGLIYEMHGYAQITINSMLNFRKHPDVLSVKLEDFESDFNDTLFRIFRHIGEMPEEVVSELVIRCKKFDISTIDTSLDPHISTGKVRKWDDYFSEEVLSAYTKIYGVAHEELGY